MAYEIARSVCLHMVAKNMQILLADERIVMPKTLFQAHLMFQKIIWFSFNIGSRHLIECNLFAATQQGTRN